MRKRLLGPLASLALVVAFAAGCGPAPGAAATVDGDVIGQDEVASVVEDLGLYGLPVTPSQALVGLITAPTLVDVGSDTGYGVSDDDAVSALDNVAAQNGIDPPLDPDLSDSTLLFVKGALITAGLQGDPSGADLLADYAAQVAALDVTVSPRYGTWDPDALLQAPTYDWQLVPAPEQA